MLEISDFTTDGKMVVAREGHIYWMDRNDPEYEKYGVVPNEHWDRIAIEDIKHVFILDGTNTSLCMKDDTNHRFLGIHPDTMEKMMKECRA